MRLQAADPVNHGAYFRVWRFPVTCYERPDRLPTRSSPRYTRAADQVTKVEFRALRPIEEHDTNATSMAQHTRKPFLSWTAG